MNRLIKLQLRNIFHNKLIYVCLILTILLTPVFSFITTLGVKNIAGPKVFPQIISFLSGEVDIVNIIFIALFCCFDFTEGTTKNIIARGYTKTQYLFSKYIASLIGLLVIYTVTIIITVILFIKNGLGFESVMIYQLINCLFSIVAYTTLYGTISIILEKTGAAIIACMFAPNIITLLLGIADSKLKLDISKFWLDNVADKFINKPTLNNLTISVAYYIVYTVIIIAIGNQLLKNKEIK